MKRSIAASERQFAGALPHSRADVTLAPTLSNHYIRTMCGRVIQSGGPLRYSIVDGMNVRDSRVHNYPPRWNAAPSQELLVIRRNHQTGEVSLDPLRWGLIPYWCKDPTGGRKPINAKLLRRSSTCTRAHARVSWGFT
jgi:SOS response associated peptidase (SRAP)